MKPVRPLLLSVSHTHLPACSDILHVWLTLSFTCSCFMAAVCPRLQLLTAPLAGLGHLKARGSLAYCDDIWGGPDCTGGTFSYQVLTWLPLVRWLPTPLLHPAGLCRKITHDSYFLYFYCVHTGQEQDSMHTDHECNINAYLRSTQYFLFPKYSPCPHHLKEFGFEFGNIFMRPLSIMHYKHTLCVIICL